MAGGSSESKFTPTQTSLDPTLQPYVNKALSESSRLYEAGGPAYYGGATYVSPSQATQQALASAQTRATAGSPLLTQAQQTIQSQLGYTSPYAAKFEALGAQSVDPSAGFYQGIQTGGTPNESLAATRQTASGSYLNANPYLSGALGQANRLATESFQSGMQGIEGQAAAAGRYGSGAMGQLVGKGQDVFARALAEQNQQAYLQNYQAERAAQEAAIGRLGGLSQQDFANRMAASQALTSGQQQALQTQIGATGMAQDVNAQDLARQQAAAGMAPGLAAADYADIDRMLAIGQVQEGYTSAQQAADKARYDYEAQLPYQTLQNYGAFITGLPRGGITQEYAPNGSGSTNLNNTANKTYRSTGNTF
jgi:hypothetical protein